MKQVQRIVARPDGASYQSFPDTDTPWKIRGISETAKSRRLIEICMSRGQAEDLVDQLQRLLGIGGHR